VRSAIAAIVSLAFSAACIADNQHPPHDGELIVFHAGSAAAFLNDAAEKFERMNPGLDIRLEAAGSLICIRKITDMGRRCDLLVSSDAGLIEELLVPEHADWCVEFAGNEMTVAYSDASRRSKEITDSNWHSILADPSVVVGRSDPDCDPCGYRTIMMFELAGKYYGISDLCERLLRKDSQLIRPREIDLLQLLDAGAADYIIIYRSAAEQHGLRFVALPPQINLGDNAMAQTYASVSAQTQGAEFNGKVSVKAAPISYGAAIPRGAGNPAAAAAFLAFLLSEDEGAALLKKAGMRPAEPRVRGALESLPPTIGRLVRSAKESERP